MARSQLWQARPEQARPPAGPPGHWPVIPQMQPAVRGGGGGGGGGGGVGDVEPYGIWPLMLRFG